MLPNSLHVLNFVGTCIGTRPNRFVVFNTEVDAGYRILTGNDSDLVCCLVLEAW